MIYMVFFVSAMMRNIFLKLVTYIPATMIVILVTRN